MCLVEGSILSHENKNHRNHAESVIRNYLIYELFLCLIKRENFTIPDQS